MSYMRLPNNRRAFLEQYRLEARRLTRRNLVGGHIVQRQGQSLDFHDYASYTPGDDIRHVDWRTSMRTYGREVFQLSDKWLIRRFMADRHMTLYISIDTHPTMTLPRIQTRNLQGPVPNISKLQIALWLAEALSFVAMQYKDQVVWHPLFGRHAGVRPMNRVEQIQDGYKTIESAVAQLTSGSDADMLNQEGLSRYLPPSAAWIIITDFYFSEKAAQQLLGHIQAAQEGRRWIILVDLDSWGYEQAMLLDRFCQIEGPESESKKLRATKVQLEKVRSRIIEHKHTILESIKRVDCTEWRWGMDLNTAERIQSFFEKSFQGDLELKRLFMKDG